MTKINAGVKRPGDKASMSHYPSINFVNSSTNVATARDKYWSQKASTMPQGHLLSLLSVCMVMIAIVMEYKYSNNDVHYVARRISNNSYTLLIHTPPSSGKKPVIYVL